MTDTQSIDTADQLTDQDIETLLEANDSGPCISIYLDTLPTSDGKDKNRIRYKDQLNLVSDTLNTWEMDNRLRTALIDQLDHVGSAENFWIYQHHGLAVFLSPQRMLVRKLMARPGNRVIVADSFHLRPALQINHGAQRHHILCISADQVALYISDGHTIQPVTLHPDVPTDIASTIGEASQLHQNSSHEKGGEDSDQLRRFFQSVDQAIWRYHSYRAGLPLLLAALSEHQGIYRQASDNANLLQVGLERDPFHDLNENELAKLAWELVSPAVSTRVDALLERFYHARAHERGATALPDIGPAAVNGRVEALLMAQGEQVAGSVDPDSGAVTFASDEQDNASDIVDSLAKLTLRADGELWFIPPEQMPVDTGAAAIYRYAVEQHRRGIA